MESRDRPARTAVLAVIAILAVATPIVQPIVTVIQLGVATDHTADWRAEGCPVHHLDGSIGHLCKKAKSKSL
jgi:hypothetical protein